MDTPVALRQVLDRCEREIRALAAAALDRSDYSALRSLTDLAEEIASCRARYAAPEHGPSDASPAQRDPKRGRSRAAKAVYPRFARQGNALVKIGWSKKEGAEYEHRAPLESVVAFVRHLSASTRVERIWTVDDILPVPDADGDGSLPEYQVYLLIGWLRSVSLIEKQGRNGYFIRPPGITQEAVDAAMAAVRPATVRGSDR